MKKKVTLITTGGTIASKEMSKGLLDSGVLSGEELASLCQLPENIEINIVDAMNLPSMHITPELMSDLKDIIKKEFEDETVSGIVVTHGTDSLEETAYFLDLTVDDSRPVVVTGSQRSPQDVGTDVYSNLRNSINVAVDSRLGNAGTVVVFNERIYSAKYVKKIHTSNLQGFDSFGYGYLGIIDNDIVSIYQKPVYRDTYSVHKDLPRVDIIKCYTGADGALIDASVAAGAQGIVLEGVGRGQATPFMMNSIRNALSLGVKIIITTSAEEGQVYPSYGYKGSANDLKLAGVILGEDYECKKARIKLAVMLASDIEVTQENFSRS